MTLLRAIFWGGAVAIIEKSGWYLMGIPHKTSTVYSILRIVRQFSHIPGLQKLLLQDERLEFDRARQCLAFMVQLLRFKNNEWDPQVCQGGILHGMLHVQVPVVRRETPKKVIHVILSTRIGYDALDRNKNEHF